MSTHAHALYAFFDRQTTSEYSGRKTDFAPSLFIKNRAINNLLRYAFRHYFAVEAKTEKPMSAQRNGLGFYEGIYFSTAVCHRAVCVSVSDRPTGVHVQVPFPVDEAEFVKHNFCPNEQEELYKRAFGNDTLLYLFCAKRAYIAQHGLYFDRETPTDSTVQNDYTFHRDTFDDAEYFFAATPDAEFVKIDIKTVMP